jgi:hypothetical protein
MRFRRRELPIVFTDLLASDDFICCTVGSIAIAKSTPASRDNPTTSLQARPACFSNSAKHASAAALLSYITIPYFLDGGCEFRRA